MIHCVAGRMASDVQYVLGGVSALAALGGWRFQPSFCDSSESLARVTRTHLVLRSYACVLLNFRYESAMDCEPTMRQNIRRTWFCQQGRESIVRVA